jgi:hypothetical protein
MDAEHHSKIVDKLMQYRGKIPKDGHLSDLKAKLMMRLMREQVDDFIELVELLARQYEMGLIR